MTTYRIGIEDVVKREPEGVFEDDADRCMELLELPEVSTMVTIGITVSG